MYTSEQNENKAKSKDDKKKIKIACREIINVLRNKNFIGGPQYKINNNLTKRTNFVMNKIIFSNIAITDTEVTPGTK